MTTFSVIIPHRNSLQTLAKAINSVPESNAIDVIVVDNSAKPIKEEDIANDVHRRFKLCYSNPLKGAGHARNVGIQHAHGDYLIFCDADDYFTEQFFKGITNFEKKGYHKKDVIFFRAESVYANSGKPASREKNYMQWFDRYEASHSKNDFDALRFYYFVPWGKFYRREYIQEKNIEFDEVPASNDIMFTTKAAMNTNKFAIDHSVIYVVTVTENSLTRTKSSTNLKSRFLVYINHNRYLKERGYKRYSIDLLRPLKKLFFSSIYDGVWGLHQLLTKKANPFDFIYKYL